MNRTLLHAADFGSKKSRIRHLAGRMGLFACMAAGLVHAQHLTGSYTVTTPEAGLFFLNPAYLNPAVGKGILGLSMNPAALRHVQRFDIAFAMCMPQESDGSFTLQAADTTAIYDPISIESRLELREQGGMAGLGVAARKGRWSFGVAVMQPRITRLSMRIQGTIPITARFTLDHPITRQTIPDLPVEEIPMTWDIQGNMTLRLSGMPAELKLSALPVVAGMACSLGPLTLGAGLTWIRLSSGNDVSRLNTHLDGQAAGTGRPYGNEPLTGLPWSGSMTAEFSLSDDPLSALYTLHVKGDRFSASLGGSLTLGPLALGGSFSHGLPGRVTGAYELTTVHTSDLPIGVEFPAIALDWSKLPEVKGNASLYLSEFQKDTLSFTDSGTLSLGEWNSYAVGLRLSFLGAFVGGELPQKRPDFTSLIAGVYAEFPLPWLPMRLNAGFLSRTDAIVNEKEVIVPYRVVSHIGAGIAVRLPLGRWIGWGDGPSWLRLGVRSSLASMALDIMKKDQKGAKSRSLPPLTETLGISAGLETTL
jgi:hypothetical protein